jgi:secreted Zn-dependent insulinase-like peptidase
MNEGMIKSRSPLVNKPKTDLKLYEFIELESGLEVILISTEKLQEENAKIQSKSNSTCTAAAALTVQVGSYSDPIECEGLAHFLEHMVFMGR